ncbi:MAG TPA: sugar phosphate isomerase/epimerase [Planctomycetes bacterium]|nr:sugar phosphate isomerase/epimerase [Planctomycetota bacterium]
MRRPITLFTGQWADLPLVELCSKARDFGYEGLELASWGDHFSVERALGEDGYCAGLWDLLEEHGLSCWAVSNHLVGQAVCDPIDERHRGILPASVWGDGDPEGVRNRAAEELKNTARAVRRFFDQGPSEAREREPVVTGFTGSPIWHMAYAFPPVSEDRIDAGFGEFAERFLPILEVFAEVGLRFALEVHPTEIAFDTATADRALAALGGHPSFGFNFDPSHLLYQGVDYLGFLREFHDRIFHVHVKDVAMAKGATRAGVFGGHLPFGALDRCWDFRSPGRGDVDFEGIVRILQKIGYMGPLSVEWEDPLMDREHGAAEACGFVRRLDFPPSMRAFDASFSETD